MIFVHGWTCDETSWSGQVPVISRSFRVITLDLPGHGRSGTPASGRFSMTLFARAVDAVRSDANVDRAILVGHSMGVSVIREYAVLYPDHAAALALVDGGVFLPHISIARFTSNDGLAELKETIGSHRDDAPGPTRLVRRIEFVKVWLSDQMPEFQTLASYNLA